MTDAGELEAERYRAAWRSLRIRRAVSWGLLLLYLPGLVLWRLLPPGGGIEPGFAWFSAVVVGLIWHGLFRCPRCGRLFNWSGVFRNPFTSKCLNCRIRLGEVP